MNAEDAEDVLLRAETLYEEEADGEIDWVKRNDAAHLFAKAFRMCPELAKSTDIADGFDSLARKHGATLAAILSGPHPAEGIYNLMIQRQLHLEQMNREYEAHLLREQEEFKQRIPFKQAVAYCLTKTVCKEFVHLALFWSLLGWAHCKQKVLMSEVPIRTRDGLQFKELDCVELDDDSDDLPLTTEVQQFLDAALAHVCSFDTVEAACNFPNREPLVIITEYGTPLKQIWFEVYRDRDVTGSIHEIFGAFIPKN